MKFIKTSLIGMLACMSLPTSAAEGVVIERAYEVALSDFRAPPTTNSAASFKTCADCELLTVRVTPRTRYVLSNESVELKDFRRGISRARKREDVTITVLHHLESDTITAVTIDLR
jgi:hypothetical protein